MKINDIQDHGNSKRGRALSFFDWTTRLGVLVVLTAILIAAATPPPAPRIGVVDSKQITAESKTIRAMIGDAARKAEELRGELQKSKAELTDRIDAYTRQKSVLAADEKKRREDAIQQLSDEIEVLDFRLGREIKKSQEGMVGPMSEKVRGAIKEVSTKLGLTVVLTTQDVVYYDAAIDVTSQVIEKLDS